MVLVMEVIMMILRTPYFHIGLEIAAIAVLLYFVLPWTKVWKQWKEEQEKASEQKKEDELLQMLANDRRTR